METTLLDDILRLKDTLPKKQRILCQYLALNYERVGVMTVAELASEAGVGPTTVMRLIQTLGYESFSSFKRELTNLALLKNATSYHGQKQNFGSDVKASGSNTFQSVIVDGLHVLENLCTPPNLKAFEEAIDRMLRSDHVYTVGFRSSKALALYFEYVTNRFYPRVSQLSLEGEFIYDRISLCMKPSDVLLIFSVWPCTRRTVEVGKLCRNMGIPVILVTNTSLNPLAKIADVVLDADSVNHSSGDVPLFAIVEALAVELGRRTEPESTKNLEHIEQILSENNLIMIED